MGLVKMVAFDVNGTLFDDNKVFWRAINDIFAEYGKERLSLDVLKERFGQPWTNIYRENGISEEMAGNDELYEVYNRLYWNYVSQDPPRPSPGLEYVMSQLISMELPVVIVSAQQNSITVPHLEYFGRLRWMFCRICGGVSDKADSLRCLAKEARIFTAEIVYIGDQVGDVRHAKNAGCISVAFSKGIHSKERLTKESPDFIIDSMQELLDLPIF